MTEAVLTLDRGNSTLDCMLWHAGQSGARQRLQPDAGELRSFLADAPSITGCLGVSVVPEGLAAAAVVLADHGVALRTVGADVAVPLRVDYQEPTLGRDRLVAAYGASQLHGTALVVDCGSATTLSLVAGDHFLGGVIGPGLPALQQGMQRVTPFLPEVQLGQAFELPANSTPDAVQAGLELGYAGLVEGLCRRLIVAADLHEVPWLLTGGSAELLLRHASCSFEPVPDLIHQGLRWLLVESSS